MGMLLLLLYVGAMMMMVMSCYGLYSRVMKENRLTARVEAVQKQPGYIEMESVPITYIQTMVQVEDQRFYQHHGLDYLIILQNLNPFRQANHQSITEQVIENLEILEQKGPVSGIVQWILAKRLEKQYSKQEILELYINTTYFGNGYYGLGRASQGYFHKEPAELSQKECLELLARHRNPKDYTQGMNQIQKQLGFQNSALKKLENWLYDFGIRWLKDQAD